MQQQVLLAFKHVAVSTKKKNRLNFTKNVFPSFFSGMMLLNILALCYLIESQITRISFPLETFNQRCFMLVVLNYRPPREQLRKTRSPANHRHCGEFWFQTQTASYTIHVSRSDAIAAVTKDSPFASSHSFITVTFKIFSYSVLSFFDKQIKS